jgi:uncharacterized protein YcbK (DUF882 family)
MTRAIVGLLLWVGTASAAPARFFIMGTGRLAITNAHTGEKTAVRYRRDDGTYDGAALSRIRRAFRSRGDGGEAEISLRLIEILSHLQRIAGDRPLVLLSGYRSPSYNKDLKDQGRGVASGSLHTEGLAADLAFPRSQLPKLWHQVRALECCGAGYYAKHGFMHVDVGRPRFWEPATSGVEQDLSAGNARLFARTEFDRYPAGEMITVTLHAVTLPPIRLAREVRAVETGSRLAFRSENNCLVADGSGASFQVDGEARAGRDTLEIRTCEPRAGQTPEAIRTNLIEVY